MLLSPRNSCPQPGHQLRENLQQGRAAYGKQILATVSQELTAEFGHAFTLRSLYRAIQFCQFFPDEEIVSTLSTQLSWSHFIELLPLKDPLARDFYAQMCRIERWDVRTLRLKIGGMLFQRTALSRKPKSVIASELAQLPPLPLLRARLHQAIEHAREQAARRLPDPRGRQ